MRRYAFTLLIPAILCVLASCDKKDNARPKVNPSIHFRQGEGYTFTNDTVSPSDTVRVGVIISRGTDAMDHIKVTRSYDNGTPQATDSIPLGSDSFEFDKLIITRPLAGTERWSFDVVEKDGDVVRRALTLVVQ